MKKGWEVREFKDCLQKIKSTKKIPKKSFLAEGKYPIVSQEYDYINGYWNKSEDLLKVEKPIVVFGDHTKIVKFIDFDFVKGADGIVILLPIEEINSKFFAYQLQNIKLRDLGYARHYRLLKEKEIVFPSLNEQKAIVAKLDQAFKAIDQAKANVERNIANAEDLFQSQLNQIFSQTGEGWEEKKLGDIGEIQTGTTPSTKNNEFYGDYIPFAKPAHFNKDGSINTKESKLSKLGLEKGRLIKENSILMVCIGATIGKTGYSEIKISSNQQINSLTPEGKVEPKIFYYALISPFVQKQILESGKSAQATLPIINKSKWSNIKVRFPLDIEEQKKYVIKLQKTRELTDMTKTNYQQKLESLKELKQSILEKAFKGELV